LLPFLNVSDYWFNEWAYEIVRGGKKEKATGAKVPAVKSVCQFQYFYDVGPFYLDYQQVTFVGMTTSMVSRCKNREVEPTL